MLLSSGAVLDGLLILFTPFARLLGTAVAEPAALRTRPTAGDPGQTRGLRFSSFWGSSMSVSVVLLGLERRNAGTLGVDAVLGPEASAAEAVPSSVGVDAAQGGRGRLGTADAQYLGVAVLQPSASRLDTSRQPCSKPAIKGTRRGGSARGYGAPSVSDRRRDYRRFQGISRRCWDGKIGVLPRDHAR